MISSSAMLGGSSLARSVIAQPSVIQAGCGALGHLPGIQSDVLRCTQLHPLHAFNGLDPGDQLAGQYIPAQL
jgi:hypothetical protein